MCSPTVLGPWRVCHESAAEAQAVRLRTPHSIHQANRRKAGEVMVDMDALAIAIEAMDDTGDHVFSDRRPRLTPAALPIPTG